MELPPQERSKRLHNFALPHLRWGHQRFLKCVKLPSSSSSSPSPDHRSPAVAQGGGEFIDLVCDRKPPPKVSTLGNNEGGGGDAARPWNLRTRRAACNEPGDEEPPTTRMITTGVKREDSSQKLKFSVSLLREEIEDDFTAFIGKKPPRRPKKRPRTVQKQMNTLFPGLWLAEEVTASSYDAPEVAET